MADTAAVNNKAQAGSPAVPPAGKQRAPKKPGLRLDISTLGGLGLALAGIIGGLLLEKGSIQDILQLTAAMIVLGGTLGAVLVTNPLPVVRRAFRGLGAVFFERPESTAATIEALIQYAAAARRQGIVSLELQAAAIDDSFLRKALNLAVDGTDLQELRKMMETRYQHRGKGRGEDEAQSIRSGGRVFAHHRHHRGRAGAHPGHEEPRKHRGSGPRHRGGLCGHGVRRGPANFFFLPAANKLRARVRGAALLKEMALEGVVGIVEGLNPTLIRLKLESYNAHPAKPAPPPKPAKQPSIPPKQAKAPAAAAAKAAAGAEARI